MEVLGDISSGWHAAGVVLGVHIICRSVTVNLDDWQLKLLLFYFYHLLPS